MRSREEYFVLRFVYSTKLASVTGGGPREASLSALMIATKMGTRITKKEERTKMITIRAIACAELGILSVTGFRRQIGIQAQQDSYVTT